MYYSAALQVVDDVGTLGSVVNGPDAVTDVLVGAVSERHGAVIVLGDVEDSTLHQLRSLGTCSTVMTKDKRPRSAKPLHN